MVRTLVGMLVVLVVAGSAAAQYVQPPAYRGMDGATQQSWGFYSHGVPGMCVPDPAVWCREYSVPDVINDNAYGTAALTVSGESDLSDRWSQGCWYGEGLTMELSIPLGELWDGGLIDGPELDAVGDADGAVEPGFRIEVDYRIEAFEPFAAPIVRLHDKMLADGRIGGDLLFSGIIRVDRSHYKVVQDYTPRLGDGWAHYNPGFYPGRLDVTITTPDEWGDAVGGYHGYGAIDAVTVDTYVKSPCGPWWPWYGPIDLDDFATLKNNFGCTGLCGWQEGDWDCDGDADLDDFSVLKNLFGDPWGTNVPEPMTLTLLALGLPVIGRRRR